MMIRAAQTALRRLNTTPQTERVKDVWTWLSFTELRAAILARTLGIHITVAVKWQRATAGDCGAYVAEITRRVSCHVHEIESADRRPDPRHGRCRMRTFRYKVQMSGFGLFLGIAAETVRWTTPPSAPL
ncbi:hypothetical protein ACH4SK_43725 [Streptomyces inhibens]|uniref:hypothetical protein n=1 Tax=Streptomyces inhibens TaxID=2293571 RepID=UPI0037A145D9